MFSRITETAPHFKIPLPPPPKTPAQVMSSLAYSSFISPLAARNGACQWPWLQTAPVPGSDTRRMFGTMKCRWSLQTCLASMKPASNERAYFGLLRKIVLHPPKGGKHSLDTMDVKTELMEKDVANILIEKVRKIKYMFAMMGDGHISISPYDTAWVALVKDIHGHGVPQFPSSLQWIVDHQLEDGSWGDEIFFNAYDRLLSTLACVIALKRWGASSEQSNRGIEFLQSNMDKLREESEDHLPAGFELIFPSLLDKARSLGIDIRCDSSTLEAIQIMQDIKQKRIPSDLLHNKPTTLLYSLEGINNLDWKKLLQLKCSDGSFLGSPSSTAFAVMETKDESCMKYLENIVSRFGGGVPTVYPVEFFERLWMVDRLQRLGISRYFQDEIKECLEYVFKYWTNNGFYVARNWSVPEIDCTAMGFRILRLHGFNVSPAAFLNFYKEGQFFCFDGQTRESITPIYNLNRAAQLAFPKERILEEAKKFSHRYLREKQAKKQLLDKWIITKDLPGEVDYALDFPWIMSLPRVEARMYLDQYGGDADVWIAKTLYRMPYVCNNTFLDLAKFDFNQCQTLLQEEWNTIKRWFRQHEIIQYGNSNHCLLVNYFLAASIIFDPLQSIERMNWAQTAMLVEALYSYVKQDGNNKLITELVDELHRVVKINPSSFDKSRENLITILLRTIEDMSIKSAVSIEEKHSIGIQNNQEMFQKKENIKRMLLHTWYDWIVNILNKGLAVHNGEKALLLVRTLELSAGRFDLEDALSCTSFRGEPNVDHDTTSNKHSCSIKVQEIIRLASLTKSICHSLTARKHPSTQKDEDMIIRKRDANNNEKDSLESNIQELTKHVLNGCSPLDINTRQSFLNVVKSFYYATHCPPSTIDFHITKVLFERVL